MFEAAARTGSFTAAAAEFNVTQPSISRNIAQLETLLGAALFVRGVKGLHLTIDGTELHGAVRSSLGQIAQTIESIARRQSGGKPVITLSLSSSFVAHWLLPRLGEFHADFPQIDLRFDLIAGTMRDVPNNIDLATRIIPDDDAHFHHWRFAPEVIIPVCSPAYLATHGVLDHDGDGNGHIFLHLSDHALPQWATNWGRVADRKQAKGTWHEFSDYAVILQAALNGEGVALGWISVIAAALLKKQLVPASAKRIATGRYHSLIAPRDRPLNPIVPDIATWLVSRMAEDLHQLDRTMADWKPHGDQTD